MYGASSFKRPFRSPNYLWKGGYQPKKGAESNERKRISGTRAVNRRVKVGNEWQAKTFPVVGGQLTKELPPTLLPISLAFGTFMIGTEIFCRSLPPGTQTSEVLHGASHSRFALAVPSDLLASYSGCHN